MRVFNCGRGDPDDLRDLFDRFAVEVDEVDDLAVPAITGAKEWRGSSATARRFERCRELANSQPRLTPKSDEKACLTISPTRVHRTEAESAFLSRMKCGAGLISSMLSKERLSEAVKNVGQSPAEVERELKKLA
jgi:hypothetical protein